MTGLATFGPVAERVHCWPSNSHVSSQRLERFLVRRQHVAAIENDAVAGAVIRHRRELAHVGGFWSGVDRGPVAVLVDPGVVEDTWPATSRSEARLASAEHHHAIAGGVVHHGMRRRGAGGVDSGKRWSQRLPFQSQVSCAVVLELGGAVEGADAAEENADVVPECPTPCAPASGETDCRPKAVTPRRTATTNRTARFGVKTPIREGASLRCKY